MPRRGNQDGLWYRTFRARKSFKENQYFGRPGPRRPVILLGFMLAAAGLWGIIAIFGPVLVSEAAYQTRNLIGGVTGNYGMWNAFRLPSFSIPEFGEGMQNNEIGMVIPKIYLREKVINEVDPVNKPAYMRALRMGVAHAAGTAGPGEPGLGYYFAHSSGMNVLSPQKKAAFYLLGKLESGDVIYVYRGNMTYEYRVTEKKITEAGDLSFLTDSGINERIVLQTCWPIGTSLRRLLIFGERV